MSVFHTVVSIQLGWLIIAAAAILGASVVVLGLSMFFSRRWYVTIRKSEETELVKIYLSRIADAVERLAASREARIEFGESRERSAEQPAIEQREGTSEPRSVRMSMFGL